MTTACLIALGAGWAGLFVVSLRDTTSPEGAAARYIELVAASGSPAEVCEAARAVTAAYEVDRFGVEARTWRKRAAARCADR